MKFTNIVLALALVLGVSTHAFAKGGSGLTFIPSINYESTSLEDKDGGVTTKDESSSMVLNAKFGYTMGMGLYLGGIYYMDSSETTSGGTTTKSPTNGYGASVGYLNNGFNAIVSYLLSATYEPDATSEATGTAILVDIGYSFMFGNWGFGPQLTYSSFAFDEIKNAGVVDVGHEVTVSDIDWGVQFMFFF